VSQSMKLFHQLFQTQQHNRKSGQRQHALWPPLEANDKGQPQSPFSVCDEVEIETVFQALPEIVFHLSVVFVRRVHCAVDISGVPPGLHKGQRGPQDIVVPVKGLHGGPDEEAVQEKGDDRAPVSAHVGMAQPREETCQHPGVGLL